MERIPTFPEGEQEGNGDSPPAPQWELAIIS